MSLTQKARKFAEKAHFGQIRKYTGEPYINHPVNVALIVLPFDCESETLSAALLHDVVEDTDYTIEDISKHFGACIAGLVDELTDVSKPSDGNRKTRKAIDRQHISKASPTAKTIKLADLIDNSLSIIEHDKKFAKVYMAEKEALLEVLSEGNELLFKNACDIVNQYRRRFSI